MKNAGQVLDYLGNNADKWSLDTEKAGLILQVPGGYLGTIRGKNMMKDPSGTQNGSINMTIEAESNRDFSTLQSAESTNQFISFFDKYLRDGQHTESDPFTLKCPPDSWIDPVTNPVPGTTYHLFPTPVRGKGQMGSYLIYLPRDYASTDKRYPVIYWLHCGNGNSREGVLDVRTNGFCHAKWQDCAVHCGVCTGIANRMV